MSNIDWIGFLPTALAIILAPGPGSLFVAKSAASSGHKMGFNAMLGVMTGDIILITISFLGMAAIFNTNPFLLNSMKLFGACYLIYIGLLSFRNSKQNPESFTPVSEPFRKGLFITLLNPKAIIFFMAFFPLFIKSDENHFISAYILLAISFVILSQIYFYFLGRLSSKIGTFINANHMLHSYLIKGTGSLFILFGLKIAISNS